jgi:hypothetical protein
MIRIVIRLIIPICIVVPKHFNNNINMVNFQGSRLLELPRYAPGTHLQFRCPQVDGTDEAVLCVCEVSNVHTSPDPPSELSLPDGKIMRVPQPERYTALLATGRVVAQQQISLFRPLSPRQKEREWARSMSRLVLDTHDTIQQVGRRTNIILLLSVLI